MIVKMMQRLKKLTALAVAAVAACAVMLVGCGGDELEYTFPNRVSVYVTTGTKASLLGRKSSLKPSEYKSEDYSRQTVYIDATKTYQSFKGYGASLTHSSAYVLMQADEQTRNTVLDDLFSREGANLSVVRIPVGASDYIEGSEYFTCDDMPTGETDLALEHFDLDHDENIIEIALKIKQINPDVKFMASPWSAPAWMKKNESLVGAGGLKEDMFEAYADYLVKFIDEYGKAGIDISMLTLLNEPSVGALSYPTMDMNALEAARLTGLVGRRLSGRGVDIVAWDFNYGSGSGAFADTFLEAIYEDNGVGRYSSTVGLHGYDGDGYFNPDNMYGMKDGIQKITRDYGKAAIITEITESAAGTDFASNLTYACKNIVISPCAVQTDDDGNAWRGCGGALYWNYVLDSDGQPTPAYHGNDCYGVISLDEVKGNGGEKAYKYEKSSAYYAMAHVSKFLYDVKGTPCRAVKATTDYVDLCVMAFYRNDGAIVAVVCNTNETNDAPLDLVIGDKKVSYDMAPQSIATFVC